jgi:predicted RecA/RadA family phage recombinase
MRIPNMAIAFALAAALIPAGAWAQQIERGNRDILDMVRALKPGQYVWAPELGANGPALVVVNLETQRLVLFRNGVPVAASTVSSGKTGHETPTGVFSILEKNAVHHSKTYNNAAMPNMQRLTSRGIALHAGNLPGYPASHGCVRLPLGFSKLLFGATNVGMTVVITSIPALPRDSNGPELAQNQGGNPQQGTLSQASYEWHPVPPGPDDLVSVIVSTADQRAIVMQGGKQIGSAPVRVSGQAAGATAYVLKSWDATGKHWMKLQFSGAGGSMEVGPQEVNRFDSPLAFRAAVGAAVRPGSVVIVTSEPLKAGSPGKSQTVFEDDASK